MWYNTIIKNRYIRTINVSVEMTVLILLWKEVEYGLVYRFYKKEKWIKKSAEIEGKLYDNLKEISSNELDASINKIIDACIDELQIGEKVIIYKKEQGEINVARSIIIRESMYKKLEDMREKYGISISKLVNIAIREGLAKYNRIIK